jgi:hypothetical protein
MLNATPSRTQSRTAQEHFEAYSSNFMAHRDSQRTFADRKSETGDYRYAFYWTFVAAIGLLLTVTGLIVGTIWASPLTGIIFPIGITILLAVAYGARASRKH